MFTLELEIYMDRMKVCLLQIGDFHGRDEGMLTLELESSMDEMKAHLL